MTSQSRGRAAGLVALWLADLLTNLVTGLLADSLGQPLPSADFGWLALLGAVALGLTLLAAGLRENKVRK